MIVNEIKGTFKQPVKKYYLGKLKFGCPYMYPRKFNSTIFTINKEKRKYDRNPNINILWRNISFGSPIWIHKNDIGWKEKYNTPRFEWSPAFIIFFFKWQFCIFWHSPDDSDPDKYWEMILWWFYYCDKDIKKAEATWGWKTRGKSTWDPSLVTTIENRNNIIDEILN